MSRSYACIISAEAKRDSKILTAVARQFAHSIEIIEDGILFDVSGLERLIGKPEQVAQKILAELKRNKVSGSVGRRRNASYGNAARTVQKPAYEQGR